jgi:hypothetical protein
MCFVLFYFVYITIRAMHNLILIKDILYYTQNYCFFFYFIIIMEFSFSSIFPFFSYLTKLKLYHAFYILYLKLSYLFVITSELYYNHGTKSWFIPLWYKEKNVIIYKNKYHAYNRKLQIPLAREINLLSAAAFLHLEEEEKNEVNRVRSVFSVCSSLSSLFSLEAMWNVKTEHYIHFISFFLSRKKKWHIFSDAQMQTNLKMLRTLMIFIPYLLTWLIYNQRTRGKVLVSFSLHPPPTTHTIILITCNKYMICL